MPDITRSIVGLSLLVVSFQVSAFMQPADESSGNAVGVLELPDMEVRDERQEFMLRLIKSGLDANRSSKFEDRDQPYCWFDKPTGSHLTYLYCSLNKYLDQASRSAQAVVGYGSEDNPTFNSKIFRSARPVNRVELRERLARLGSGEVNDEILDQALQGAPLPEAELPDDAELERFSAALVQVRDIRADVAGELEDSPPGEREAVVARGDEAMARAIEEAGLSVNRYNEISGLVERFDSLRKQVRSHIAGN